MVGSLIGGLLPAFFVFAVKGLHLQEQLAVQYQYTLLTAGIFVLSAFFPLFFIKEKKITVEPSKRTEPLFSGRRPFVLKFTLCSILIGLGAGIIVPYFNVYFSQVLYATEAEIGLIFSLGELSMGIASLVLPFLVRRFGKVGSLVLTQFLSIPFLLLIMISRRLFPAFIGFFMRRTLMNVARPAEKNFYMGEIPEHERGKANSISQFGSTIFRAAGSDIGGYMIATGTFSHAFQVTAILYVVGTVLFYVFFRKKNE